MAHANENNQAPTKQTLHEGRFLSLVKEGHWEYATRPRDIEAVGLIAVTPERALILVEQHRIPVHAPTIELPAGLAFDEDGQADDDLADCARRELLEETGYDAQHLEEVADVVSSAGLTDESCHLFLATGLKKVAEGGGVAGENITVHTIPVDGLKAWLATQTAQGKRVDARVYAALAFI